MASGRYSFIDIAALDPIRTRFAAGDALVLLSEDLQTVLWANGAGAALFGFPDIEAVIGAPAGLGLPARRQIQATRGFPDIGRDKAILVRLSNAFASRAVGFLASGIVLAGGERAILLAAPAAEADAGDEAARARRALAGITEAGYFAAITDGEGGVIAATEGFPSLGIEQSSLHALALEASEENDRPVKRLLPAGEALYPAGFARLTDDPAQHLLLVVAEDQSEEAVPEEPAPSGAPPAAASILEQDNQRLASSPPASGRVSVPPPDGDGGRGQIDRWYFGVRDKDGEDSGPTAGEQPASLASPDEPASLGEEPVPENLPKQQPPRVTPAPAPPQRQAGPVRFVWRTDAEGRFSAISEDFAQAVGASAADVVGRRFRDVANAFGLDADGEIAGLLERRDTWSGRSVLWPIAGTDLKAPVDLAALPVYARDRSFEGFRGFGVVRIGDAVADAEALGLALVQGVPAAEPEPPVEPDERAEETPATPARTDPFRGEVPALVIDNTPERRFTDKVIRLAEHRQPAVERTLTPVERSAFREIGNRLKKDSAAAGKSAAQEQPRKPEETEPASATAQVEQDEAEAALAAEAAAPQASEAADADVRPADGAEPEPEETARDGRDAAEGSDRQSSDGEESVPSMAEAVEEEEVPAAALAETEADVEASGLAAGEAAEPSNAPPLQAGRFLPAAFPEEARERATQVDVSILSRLPVPVLIHSGDLLHYANREFLALTGYDSLEALEEAGGLGALFADAYDAGEEEVASADHKMRLRKSDGEEVPVEALLQSAPWNGGRALLLAIRPIVEPAAQPAPKTEEPAADELRARLAELRTILDTATDGVVLITNEGAIRSISRPAEALFGFDSAEVAGQPFTSLFAVESQRAARDYLSGLSDNGVASVLNDGREVIGREAQGRFIPLFMTIGKLPDDSGYCAVLRDITQWKRAEEELTQARAQAERSSSQKTDFLARVSHEIRTPLNAIIGFSELMIDEKFGPVGNDRYRDYLRDINRSGNHVLDLVNDLLDISKIEAGEQEMSYEAVSLNDALTESVAMLQPQANRERVIIRSSFASRLPEVVADLRSIRQIAINLLSNAIRYTPAGGQVIVSTAYEASGDIVMRVRDTGIGMTHAEIEQALKPFKQINALKRGRGDGTGLGLPLTKAMVEANRARFSINSTPGEGTMVEITFPSTRVLAD